VSETEFPAALRTSQDARGAAQGQEDREASGANSAGWRSQSPRRDAL